MNLHTPEDRDWWPFVFLRPERHQRVGSGRLLLLAILFGLPFGLALDVVYAVSEFELVVQHGWLIPLTMVGALFACYRLVLARAWNERAQRLARRKAWLEQQGPRSC
jgi:hypothetical protein